MAEAKASPKKRVYLVKSATTQQLIRASNVSQAIGFAARNTFKAAVASQDDLIDLAGKVKVEEAGEIAEPQS